MAPRKLHNHIYITIANCCLYLVISSIALATNKWFSVTTKEIQSDQGSLRVTASYGLFSGRKTKYLGNSPDELDLKIICEGTKGCMFSCGKSSEWRRQDIQNMLNGKADNDPLICKDGGTLSTEDKVQADGDNSPVFINFGLYLMTIIFAILGMVFAVVSGTLALYNTYRTPVQPVLSILGLYIWNGASAAFAFLAMMMWIIEFATRLRKNAGISDTLSGKYDSSGSGSLGVSFWILILPICFSLINIAILRYRTWKIVKAEENNVKVMTQKLESGDILLF